LEFFCPLINTKDLKINGKKIRVFLLVGGKIVCFFREREEIIFFVLVFLKKKKRKSPVLVAVV
jgi:ATP sulfurylase